MSKFSDAYKKTLKPKETEEFPNSWIFRPLAFLLVYAVKGIKLVSPNLLTCFSLICGLLSGYFLATGMIWAAFAGLLMMVIFDCSDGQLARLTGRSSKIGKILDVSADVVSYFSFFTGSAIYMYSMSNDKNVFWLIPLSFISVVLNVVFYDQFKNQYIRYVYSDYHEKIEETELLKKQAKESRGFFKKTVFYAYYFFYVMEKGLVYIGSLCDLKKHKRIFGLGKEISKEESAKFKKHFFFMTRLWSLIGTGTHYFVVLIVLAVFGINSLLPVFIIHSLGTLAVLLIIQNIVFAFYRDK